MIPYESAVSNRDMPTDETRDAAVLESISWELVRLRMEADRIGQPLLGLMLDQASVLAGQELAALRLSGGGLASSAARPRSPGRRTRFPGRK